MKIRALRARSHSRIGPLLVAGLVIGGLWLLTLIASDAPWWVVTLFWSSVGGGMLVWLDRDLRSGAFADMAADFESVAGAGVAEELRVESTGYVEFEEVEDEGACYAFQLVDGRILFLSGQEYYRSARFPSLDFSIVFLLDAGGRTADALIAKRGESTRPARVIDAEVKWRLEIPDSLSIRHGSLAELEQLLGPRG